MITTTASNQPEFTAFCFSCKKAIPVMNPIVTYALDDPTHLRLAGTCPNCGHKVSRFTKKGAQHG